MQQNHKLSVTPKPGGGGEASTHHDKHEESEGMGPLASMPGGPVDVGPLASMLGGLDEIAVLAGDSGHSAVAFAFCLTVLLHATTSLGDARAQSASSSICKPRLR